MNSLHYRAALLLICSPLLAQEALEISSDQFPRIAATEPADAIETFEVEPGFEIALAAHEPDVMDPIAMCFDEKGRAYVIEMRGYSERRDEALGRIRLLTDTNGDGIFDQSTVFKDQLKWPTAITCYRGGVFVGATPDVYYFRDNDGDGICDEERTVFTGFGGGKLKLNMQALFNSFRWGPDNRIWGATAANGGNVVRPDVAKFEPVALRNADFSFDPEKLDLRPENGTAQYGLSFDSKGRRFVCSNSRHLIWVAYERHHLKHNPWYSPPPPLVNIPDDGAAAPVYRISPDEPWRIVRTRWRVAGVVKGMVEGGGRVSGYFTSATGVHLYTGEAFGDSYIDNAFIGDVGSNLVHRKVIYQNGDTTELVATRVHPESQTEFIRSRDNWFRPTSFANGPDGCLYLTDMYREVIEHPWSLPEPIKKHLDLNSGFERGRIYRIAPTGFLPRSAPDLSKQSDDDLKGMLQHPNGWHRTTARRLLYERGIDLKQSPLEPFPANLGGASTNHDLASIEDDRWLRAAYLNSIRDPRAWAAAWAANYDNHTKTAQELARIAGKSGNATMILKVAQSLSREPLNAEMTATIVALREGVELGSHPADEVFSAEIWDNIADTAAKVSLSPESEIKRRTAALQILTKLRPGKASQLGEVLLTNPGAPQELFPEAARAVASPTELARLFEFLPRESRQQFATSIAMDPAAANQILNQLADKKLALSAIPSELLQGLRNNPEADVRKLASTILPPVVSRNEVVRQFSEALKLDAAASTGAAVFKKLCSSCHLDHDGTGIALGPDIQTFSGAGRESLISRILDPNAEVAPQFQSYQFNLGSGETLVGLIERETPVEVTIKQPGGLSRTFPRSSVESMKGLGQSLMPEGMEASLTVQEMADLLAYLTEGR
ncbi:MAG: PVC-type heme-binding CxxCH protein [Verrucomicrobiales bacterium]